MVSLIECICLFVLIAVGIVVAYIGYMYHMDAKKWGEASDSTLGIVVYACGIFITGLGLALCLI